MMASPDIGSLSLDSPVSDNGGSDFDMGSSVASLPPFSRSGTSSQTSNDMRSASPVPSVLSLTSSMDRQAYRTEFGRGLNNYSEVYKLPADDEELDRLDKQHQIFVGVMGKYPPCMEDVMKNGILGEQKQILDLGCGSGAWIIDAAKDFPNANCVGVDLVPMKVLTLPPNCRSEIDDVNLGLEHFYGDFNAVHVRLLAAGIKDYHNLIHDISLVLRPGGLLEMMEMDFSVYDLHRRRIPVDTVRTEPPWFARWFFFMKMAARGRGGDVDAATQIHRWVSDHGGFEDIVYKEYWLPTGPFTEGNDEISEWWRTVGEVGRENAYSFITGARPLLLGSGLTEEFVDELGANAKRELANNKTPGLIRLQRTYARKKHPVESDNTTTPSIQHD